MMTGVRAREYLPSEIAVLISLVLHTLAFLSWEQREWLARLPLFRPVAKALRAPASTEKPLVPVVTFVELPEDRRTFVETDASQATGEEPKNAKFYSALPTVAANPENPSGKIGDTPYLEGKETRAPSTDTVAPAPPAPPAPAPVPNPAPPAEQSPKKVAEEGIKVVEETKVAM